MSSSFSLRSYLLMETLTLTLIPRIASPSHLLPSPPLRRRVPPQLRLPSSSAVRAHSTASGFGDTSFASDYKVFPIEGGGIEEALIGFITGKRKATEVAHSVWKRIVRKGDTVVDATCGNGHDTLALLKMVADESEQGCVYGMDIQESAVESTSSMLEMSVNFHERKLVQLFSVCHSKMEDIVPKDVPVRLVAFNLGYLPGGDKTIITESRTTEMALHAACKILRSDGLISIMVYVGHPGGSKSRRFKLDLLVGPKQFESICREANLEDGPNRDEFETVQSFASNLPADTWVSCKFEMINRPTAPILVLLYKK